MDDDGRTTLAPDAVCSIRRAAIWPQTGRSGASGHCRIILLRPDGVIAWAGGEAELKVALDTWFG
ncbi:hypothetical protein G3I59_06800 [Amycolatopsis rubida]|uniref:Uncharacterized protein n=1 Tax=Amycolatopsis rubida TaxID=112413 RepID=A0A1I6BJG6_9PSEU|nr:MULTISPECIES: hypothetical protein [Amycolatopsis]MYW90336.1 hypothetical protein [Amycolatopsis rubida]NEC55313.1 hypothetical protein [Amycolatopsis rubida]OAP20755.1 hypothetical protein A4R44_08609 [Amycolatopsis sp. M39]SFQ81069.1 hypothetical protein SAMN05421854_1299 [Amycolatopsis rubida]